MKTATMTMCISLCLGAAAMPSTNTLEAVKADWRSGAFTNVFQLAEQRLAANAHDIVSRFLLSDWNMAFGTADSISNCVSEIIAESDLIQVPAYSNLYWRSRPMFIRYRDEFLPTMTGNVFAVEQQKLREPGKGMPSEYFLEVLSECGMWNAGAQPEPEGE